MTYYPIKLKSVPKSILWGGDKLKTLYGKDAPFESIAESWELTAREDGMSIVENGEYAGYTLSKLAELFPEALGTRFHHERFPLLIKFIDASDDLSIQVHPDDSYAMSQGLDCGKTEVWYIVDAEPEAAIIYGASPNVSTDELKASLLNENVAELLHKVYIKKGEVYFIPAGLTHAICKGVLIAEIQQNSNTTYRIYDYDRTNDNGKKRELHTNEALDVVRSYTDAEIASIQFSGSPARRMPFCNGEILCDCEYFRVTKLCSTNALSFTVDESAFASMLFTDADKAMVSCGGSSVAVHAGDSILLPAGVGEVQVSGSFTALLSEV